MAMEPDEFRFLWDEVKQLKDRVTNLEEAVNTLLEKDEEMAEKIHYLDMEHRPIGPGMRLKAHVLSDEETKELIERLKQI